MDILGQLVEGLAAQFSADGREVYQVFSRQLYVFLAIVLPALAGLLAYRRRLYRQGRIDRVVSRKLVLDAALGAAVLGILLITLSPKPNPDPKVDLIPLHPLWSAITGTVDATRVVTLFGANLLLFVPFGLLIPLRWRRLDRARVVLLLSAGFSAAVETLQYVMDRGRVTQVDDVVFNTLGGLAGWMLLRIARHVGGRLDPARTASPR